MAILIKGMEMPRTCLTCEFLKCAGGVGDYCSLTRKRQYRFKNIPKYCPLVELPEGDMGEVSDGYHTFNSLYYQRMILTAALVKAHKNIAWKSWKHEDGELCFGGGWFIVGFDTPKGGYTYHYEAKHWDLFDCAELPCGKHWDGHTEKDVGRLLSM